MINGAALKTCLTSPHLPRILRFRTAALDKIAPKLPPPDHSTYAAPLSYGTAPSYAASPVYGAPLAYGAPAAHAAPAAHGGAGGQGQGHQAAPGVSSSHMPGVGDCGAGGAGGASTAVAALMAARLTGAAPGARASTLFGAPDSSLLQYVQGRQSAARSGRWGG